MPTYNKTRFRYDEDGILIPSLKERIVGFVKGIFVKPEEDDE